MQSSSSSHRRSDEHNALSGIGAPGKRRKVDESSRLFDVFINHRGPDVKKTVARRLYNSLKELGKHPFLDSKEKEFGDSFPSIIENAIHSASAHIAIFSKGYAESPWCLAELILMLQSSAKIIPVFYGVKPSALRYTESGDYAEAFKRYEEKDRYMEKLREWKDALHSVSFIAGHEISNRFSASDCQNIVSAVCKEVQRKEPLHIAKYPVGLDRVVKDFERRCLDQFAEDFVRQCRMKEGGKGKAQIVGIFGMGGVGKTTLAKELFNRKRLEYTKACFLFDAREAYANKKFTDLQKKLLKDLYEEENLDFYCIEQGKSHIGCCIQRSSPLSSLIVVDDIDHLEQLNALLIRDMLNNSGNSLVIVTTRDAGLLINEGIEVGYNLEGMDKVGAKELFCWHAFSQPYPSSGYEKLVDLFVEVCGRLPLSLQVLGSHVHGTDQNFWALALEKANKTLPRDIHKRLRISIDMLDDEEKQIFMDVACFFIGELTAEAISVWKATGWSGQHALRILKNKCLVEEIENFEFRGDLWRGFLENSEFKGQFGRDYLENPREERFVLRMHDHLRDLGRQMADELSHPYRLWRSQHLESLGFENILTQAKVRCLHSFRHPSTNLYIKYFVGKSDSMFGTSSALLSLQMFHTGQTLTNFPPWIPLQYLQLLSINGGSSERLWQNNEQVPCALKELRIYNMNNLKELSWGLLRHLEVLVILNCARLESLTVISDLTKLEDLEIGNCRELKKLSLVQLTCLKEIRIQGCGHLKSVTTSALTKLVKLDIVRCGELEELSLVRLNSAKKIILYVCDHLKSFRSGGIFNHRNEGSNRLNINSTKCSSWRDGFFRQPEESCPARRNSANVKIDECEELAELRIDECEELEELELSLAQLSPECRLKSKFPTLLEVKGCKNLISVDGAYRKLVKLNIHDCPKLEKIPDIEKLHLSERVQLLYCRTETIRNYTLKMKKLPSEFIKILGRAADGAGSTLNTNLFCDFSFASSVIQKGVEETCAHLGRHTVSAIVFCAVVVVNTCTAAKTTNEIIREYDNPWLKYEVRQGEWIFTSVTSNQDDIHSYIVNKGDCFPFDCLCFSEDVTVKSVTMPAMKSEERKVLNVLNKIVDKLYQK